MSPARKFRPVSGPSSSVPVAALVLASPLPARADDLSDCTGPAIEKVEAACSAIIADIARPQADQVKALSNRARAYLGTGKIDLASADAEAALKLDENSVAALLMRGSVNHRRNNLDAAKADYDRALQLEPKNIGALMNRGNVYAQQRKWQEALADYNDAMTIRQDIAAPYVGRGRVSLETGQIENALKDFDQAIAINVNVPTVYYWRGLAWRRKGDNERALDDLSRAVAQAQKGDVGPLFARAQLYIAKGDYARAIADIDAVLAVTPDNVPAKQLRQSTFAMQTELAKARDNPAQPAPAPAAPAPGASAAAPVPLPAPSTAAPSTASPSKTLTDRALTFIAQAKYRDAVVLLDQALAMDPRNEGALRVRFLAHVRLGQLVEGRADLDELVKLRPADAS